MTISHVGSAGAFANGASVSPTLPAGISDGDAVVAVGVCQNTQTMAAPAGWTVRSGWPKDGGSARHYLWTKDTVTSGDSSTSPQFTTTATNKIAVAVEVLHSSVSFPASYFDAEAFTAHTASSSTYTAPQVTSTVAGCWGIAAFTTRGTDPTAWTPAGGLTERQDLANTGSGATSLHLTDSNGSIGAASTAWGSFDETNITATNGGGVSLLVKENTAGGTGNPFPVCGFWRNRTGVSWRTSIDNARSIFGEFQGRFSNYHAPGSLPLSAAEIQAINDGLDLHIYWKAYPAGQHWAYTAAGSYNATIDQVAQSFISVAPAHVWLTIHHEPENDTTGATGNFSYTAYKGMWQAVRDRFDAAGVTNVTWVWAFMGSLAHPTEALNLWPGNSLVDITAFQQYINYNTTPATVLASRWLDTIDWLRTNDTAQREWSDTYRDLAVTEWGADLGNVRGTDQHRADAIGSIEAILQDLADARVVSIDYFDAREHFLNDPPTVDGAAYVSLKAASEAGQTGGGGGGGEPSPVVEVGFATSGDAATQTTQTISFTLPTGWAQGDEAIAFLSANSRPDASAPQGWTLLDGPTDNGTTQRAWIYHRRLVTGDPNPTWTLSQSVRPTGILGVYRGVDPDNPVHASRVLTATSSSTSQSASSVTTTVDSWVVSAWLTKFTGVGATNPGTVPGGTHTACASASSNPGTNPGSAALLGHVTANPVTAGTHGAYTATYTTASTGLNAQLALLPAGTTPPPPDPPPPPVAGEPGVPPDLIVQAALGNPTTTDPQAGFLVLDVGPPLDTGTLGGINWVEITGDVQRVTYRRGKAGELESSAPGGIEIVLDNRSGDYDPANTLGPYYGQLGVGAAVWVRATWGSTYDLAYAYIDAVTLDLGYEPTATISCLDALEILGRAHLAVISSSFDNDPSGTRISRILDGASWPVSLRALDDGRTNLQATTYGEFALPLIQEILDTEFGILFATGAGKVAFFDRYHQVTNPRSNTIQANFTDTAGAEGSTEVEMERLEVSLSRDTVFNQATVTRIGGTEQIANNTTSQATYGIRTFPGSPGTLLRSDGEALNLAQWLVGKYPTPKQRITEVTIDATTQELWQVMLLLTLQDRIRVTRDYGPSTIVADLHIQGMTVDIDAVAGTWRWSMQTSSPTLTAPILLDVGPALNTGELGA